MDHLISRRKACVGLAAAGVTSALITNPASAKATARILTQDDLGWDKANKKYTLPPLPYAYDSLKAVIDEETMRIHHNKHHAGYVRGLNSALNKLRAIRWDESDADLIQHWQRQLSFHMGGHINHTLFWKGMLSEFDGGGGQPKGNLLAVINRDFGSFGKFTKQFKLAATKVEGSGWGWLVYEPMSNRLMISQMQNQQDMLFAGAIPLLGVDVWEHAYYLKYQNRRADYVEGFMRIINWEEISRRFESAR
ncbi:MAG: superoxide dismutase [Phycisphaerales bacterium]|nr:superoxide dismutase [Phycisphaerales bacterium]